VCLHWRRTDELNVQRALGSAFVGMVLTATVSTNFCFCLFLLSLYLIVVVVAGVCAALV
jgi:hypothetical protein